MKVKDAVTRSVVHIGATESCYRAAQLVRDHGVGLLVDTTKDQIIEGVITDRDVGVRCRALGDDPARRLIGDYLDPTTVDADLELGRAVEIRRNADRRRLPVTVAGAQVVGLVSPDDVAVDVKHYLAAFLSVASHYAGKAW